MIRGDKWEIPMCPAYGCMCVPYYAKVGDEVYSEVSKIALFANNIRFNYQPNERTAEEYHKNLEPLIREG